MEGRAKIRMGAGSKFCRGCKKKQPLCNFAVNQDLDTDCKKAYDRIKKIAVRQNQTEWLKGVFHDDERFGVLMSRFKAITVRVRSQS